MSEFNDNIMLKLVLTTQINSHTHTHTRMRVVLKVAAKKKKGDKYYSVTPVIESCVCGIVKYIVI